MMLLAGDIGATTTRLAPISPEAGPRRFVAEQEFASTEYKALQPIEESVLRSGLKLQEQAHRTQAIHRHHRPGHAGDPELDVGCDQRRQAGPNLAGPERTVTMPTTPNAPNGYGCRPPAAAAEHDAARPRR